MNTGIIAETKHLIDELFKVTIEMRDNGFTKSGQYCIIGIKGSELEKNYTVCEFDGKRFSIVVKTGNEVTDRLLELEIGDEIRVEAGLGNGFNMDIVPDGVTLVADSDGIPQMVGVLRGLLMRGKSCNLVLGYSTKSRIYMVDTFSSLCNNIEIFTADGSNGRQGNADDGVRKAEYVCAAGSVEMLDRLTLKAEHGQFNSDGMNITEW